MQRAHAIVVGTTVGGDVSRDEYSPRPCRRRRRRSPRALSRCRRRRTDLERRRRLGFKPVRIARARTPRGPRVACPTPAASLVVAQHAREDGRRRRWQSRETSPSPSPSRARRTRPTRGRCRRSGPLARQMRTCLTARCASAVMKRRSSTLANDCVSSRDATVRATRRAFDVRAGVVVTFDAFAST